MTMRCVVLKKWFLFIKIIFDKKTIFKSSFARDLRSDDESGDDDDDDDSGYNNNN